MRGSAISKAHRARILERVNQGEHPADVARDLGVNPNTARGICTKSHIPWERRQMTPEEKEAEMRTLETNKKAADTASEAPRPTQHLSESDLQGGYTRAIYHLKRLSHTEWRGLDERKRAAVDSLLDAEVAS